MRESTFELFFFTFVLPAESDVPEPGLGPQT